MSTFNRLTAGRAATAALLAVAVLAAAGGAWAQGAPAPATDAPARPTLNLALPDPDYARTIALREAGVARTSVDHRFARDGVVGSVGFLCGLQPRLDEHSGAAYGFDPHGRFLGAKLSRAF